MKDWNGVDLSAVLDFESIAAQSHANKFVRRHALAFSPLIPVEPKTFDLAEEQEAWAWIDGHRTYSRGG